MTRSEAISGRLPDRDWDPKEDRTTEMEFDESVGYVWTFREGRVIRLKSYWDPADALEAAGLE